MYFAVFVVFCCSCLGGAMFVAESGVVYVVLYYFLVIKIIIVVYKVIYQFFLCVFVFINVFCVVVTNTC